jgi:hypothetical protein
MSYFYPQVRPYCAYQKLRLILQGLLAAECKNVRYLFDPPQKINRDVVDSVASRPRRCFR